MAGRTSDYKLEIVDWRESTIRKLNLIFLSAINWKGRFRVAILSGLNWWPNFSHFEF